MFYKHTTSYSFVNKQKEYSGMNESSYYKNIVEDLKTRVDNPDPSTAINPVQFRLTKFEAEYYLSKRPYYHVYSSIIPMLTKVDLELPSNHIKPPQGIKHLALKFQPGNPLGVQTMVISFQEVNEEVGLDKPTSGIVVGVNFGNVDDKGVPIYSAMIFPLTELSVKESTNKLNMRENINDYSEEVMGQCLKLAITICLLGNDPNILQAKPLSKDVAKFNRGSTEVKDRLIEKARRKGVIAFDLGKDLETSPHYRNGCMALYWTGKGRKTPVVQWRSGGIVNRNKIIEVPTGYEG
ncbi:MAG: hypothetical protein ACW99G_12915 [Candidatus Thorarchaeota archaeon]|jgi:hypothetical protein